MKYNMKYEIAMISHMVHIGWFFSIWFAEDRGMNNVFAKIMLIQN